jgi:hypothetical protein
MSASIDSVPIGFDVVEQHLADCLGPRELDTHQSIASYCPLSGVEDVPASIYLSDACADQHGAADVSSTGMCTFEGGCAAKEGWDPALNPCTEATESRASACGTGTTTRSTAQLQSAAAPSGPMPELTLDIIDCHVRMMFVKERPAATASGLGKAITEATGAAVLLAWKAVEAWPKAYINELSLAFGNFDRVVSLGWLVGDLLGMQRLSQPHAFRVGGSAARVAKKIDGDIKLLRKKAGKLKLEDPRRCEVAAAALVEEEALLRTPFILPQVEPLTGTAGPSTLLSKATAAMEQAEATCVAAMSEYDDLSTHLTGRMNFADHRQDLCDRGIQWGYSAQRMEPLEKLLEQAEEEVRLVRDIQSACSRDMFAAMTEKARCMTIVHGIQSELSELSRLAADKAADEQLNARFAADEKETAARIAQFEEWCSVEARSARFEACAEEVDEARRGEEEKRLEEKRRHEEREAREEEEAWEADVRTYDPEQLRLLVHASHLENDEIASLIKENMSLREELRRMHGSEAGVLHGEVPTTCDRGCRHTVCADHRYRIANFASRCDTDKADAKRHRTF